MVRILHWLTGSEIAPDHTVMTVVTGTVVTVANVAVPVVTGPVVIATIEGIRISARMIATVTVVRRVEASSLYIGKQMAVVTVAILLTVLPVTVAVTMVNVACRDSEMTGIVMTVTVVEMFYNLRGRPHPSGPGVMIEIVTVTVTSTNIRIKRLVRTVTVAMTVDLPRNSHQNRRMTLRLSPVTVNSSATGPC
jgi:hypothetical protein